MTNAVDTLCAKPAMRALVNSEHGRRWLSQFKREDQQTALHLLQHLVFVDEQELSSGLLKLFEPFMASTKFKKRLPLAVYVEKEVPKYKGEPKRLFKEVLAKSPSGSKRRAIGVGAPWIYRLDTPRGETGSEGLLGNLVTQLLRGSSGALLSRPGPDRMRKKKARTFVVVTDFVGSGTRVYDFLTAAWKAASIKSWRSRGHITFVVLAYSGTKEGIAHVEAHPAGPEVKVFRGCPTLDEIEPKSLRAAIQDLCSNNHPYKLPNNCGPRGYRDIGSLMIFAHGCPNTAPMNLHGSSGRWQPLFKGRSVLNVLTQVAVPPVNHGSKASTNGDDISQNFELRYARQLRHRPLRVVYEVLSAASKGFRTTLAISARCEITIVEAETAVERLIAANWLTDSRRPTDEGLAQRDAYKKIQARSTARIQQAIASDNDIYYIPKSLRRPRKI